MSDNKKYYYLKLKDNFFESDELKILQNYNSGKNEGYVYSDILLKMYLKSLQGNGALLFKNRIPYKAEMLATVTNHSVGEVKDAIEKFKALGLVEVLDDGAIFMNDIQLFVGKSSTEAERVKAYRDKLKSVKKIKSVQMYDKSTPEIRDKRLEIRDKNKNNSPHSDKPKYGPDDRPYQISQHLLGKIRENNPDFKQPNLQHWANDIRLAHDRDKRDYDKLDNMVDWCQNNDFWQANILSGKKLRDKYDRLAAEANRKFKANKQVRTKETLPDWATEQAPTATKKKLTPEQQVALKQRMAKLYQRNSEREEETT